MEHLQALMAWRPSANQLWILGCLAAWVLIVFLITRLMPRPTKWEDDEQVKAVSRPAPLSAADATREVVRKVRAGVLRP